MPSTRCSPHLPPGLATRPVPGLRLVLVLGLLPLLLSACGTEPAPLEPVTLFVGGTILTLAEPPEVEALAVRGAEIVAAGSREELEAAFQIGATVDLAGATLLPGFVDSHAHVHEMGKDLLLADLTGTESVEEMIERVRRKFPNPEPGAWLVGQGWDEGAWASRGYPDREELDLAFPENPVWLASLHGFAGLANARALGAAGIDASTPDPKAGAILRREGGVPTGVLLTLAQGLVSSLLPADSDEQIRAAILAGLEQMAAAGVTTVHEAGLSPAVVDAYRALAAEGALPIRVRVLLDGNDRDLVEHWIQEGPQNSPDGFLTIRGFKVFYDGSLGSRTALLREPYADEPEAARPAERISPDEMRWLAEHAAHTGFQMAVHAIGDEGNDRVLGIFENALRPDYAGNSNPDHRWRIEHAQVVQPDFYERAARLGVIASMQSSHAVGDSAWAEARLGPERIRDAYAWRRMLEAGVELVLNSDLPGEPWQPLETLYFAVTRERLPQDLARGVSPVQDPRPEEALSPMEALQAMTVAGARAGFDEHRLGRLTPGLFADFVELSENPLTVPPERLPAIEVQRVWVGGRQVVGSATE